MRFNPQMDVLMRLSTGIGTLALASCLAGVAVAEPWPPASPSQDRQSSLMPTSPEPSLLAERDKRTFRRIAHVEADKAKVPFDLVDAVMKIESGYNPGALGDLDEIGLMQVRPGTAAMLGFRSAEESLATPAVNIHYGTLYLGEAWRLAGGNVCRALMKYRAGHGQESMSALSVNYCARAKAHLVAINSPLAAGIGEVDLIPAAAEISSAPAAPALREPSGRPKQGAAFWSAFSARIRHINARIEAKWRRTASR